MTELAYQIQSGDGAVVGKVFEVRGIETTANSSVPETDLRENVTQIEMEKRGRGARVKEDRRKEGRKRRHTFCRVTVSSKSLLRAVCRAVELEEDTDERSVSHSSSMEGL